MVEKVSSERGPSVESVREGFEIQQGLEVRPGKKQPVIRDPLGRLAPVDRWQRRSQSGRVKAYSRFRCGLLTLPGTLAALGDQGGGSAWQGLVNRGLADGQNRVCGEAGPAQ